MISWIFCLFIFFLSDSSYKVNNKKEAFNNNLYKELNMNYFKINNHLLMGPENLPDLKKIIIILLKEIIADRTTAYLAIINNSESIINLTVKYFNENNMTSLNHVIVNILNTSNTFINDTFDIICNTSNNVANNLIALLNKSNVDFMTVIYYLRNIFIVSEVENKLKGSNKEEKKKLQDLLTKMSSDFNKDEE